MGGAERTLLKIMARGRDRFDFLVATSGPGEFSTTVAQLGIPLIFIPLRPPFSALESPTPLEIIVFLAAGIRDVVSLWKLIGAREVDLVCTLTRGAHIYGGIAGRMRRVPVIFQLHDIPQRFFARHMYRTLFRACAAGGIAVSKAVASGFTDVRDKNEKPTKCKISHNGIDIESFQQRLTECSLTEHDLGLQADHYPVVTTIGRLSPYKGVDTFIQAAHLVRQEFPQALFLIVGTAWKDSTMYVSHLERLVHNLGLNFCIRFLGQRDDVPGILARSDILVSAAQFEPFGLTVIEGMAAGLPVVATRCGGLEEIITDGEDGFLVPVGNASAMAEAILSLARNPDLAREMGKRGHRKVERDFSIERHVEDVLSFYEEILINYRRPSRS